MTQTHRQTCLSTARSMNFGQTTQKVQTHEPCVLQECETVTLVGYTGSDAARITLRPSAQ